MAVVYEACRYICYMSTHALGWEQDELSTALCKKILYCSSVLLGFQDLLLGPDQGMLA